MAWPRGVIGFIGIVLFVEYLTFFTYRHPLLSCRESDTAPAFKLIASNGRGFPRKIWQTSKHSTMELGQEYRDNIMKWNEVNPRWRHELLTDAGSDEYVRGRFRDDWPEVVEFYTGLADNIMRADMFRYLVLLGDGGLYCDIDTEALRPIESWIPQDLKNRTNAVLGIEYDTFGQGRGQALLDLQFTNWTLMSKARHRLMQIVVANVIEALKSLMVEQNVPLELVKASFNDVLASTGPVQLTRSTWQYLSEVTGEEFLWKTISGLKEPMLVYDVLLLPVTAFGNGQAHSLAGPSTDPQALVHHQFKGTWKTGSHSYNEMKNSEKHDW